MTRNANWRDSTMTGKNLADWQRREFLQVLSAGMAAGAWELLSPHTIAQAAGMPSPGAADWPRFGFDLHNTRFNAREKKLGPGNIARLKLKWSREIGAPIQ